MCSSLDRGGYHLFTPLLYQVATRAGAADLSGSAYSGYVSSRSQEAALQRTTFEAALRTLGHMDSMKLSAGTCVLLSIAAVTLAVASLLHFGVAIPLGSATISDPFADAAIPEAVIAVVVAAAAVATLARLPAAGWMALAATLFALAGTLYGLTVTLRRGQAGDIVYHLGLLTILIASAVLLLVALRRRGGTTQSGPA